MIERESTDQLSLSFEEKKVDPKLQERDADHDVREPTTEETDLAKNMLPVGGREITPVSRAEARRLEESARAARESLRKQLDEEGLFASSSKK